MKSLLIIILFCSILFGDMTKQQFLNSAIKQGWEINNCSFGSAAKSLAGTHYSKVIAISKAVDKLVIQKCSYIDGELQLANAKVSYRVLLTSQVQDRYIVAICAKKVVCKGKE